MTPVAASRPGGTPGGAASAPEPITVTRWRCPFCGRTRAHKRTTAEHIGRCWLNPAAHACKTCAHYEYDPGGDPCFPGRPCDCNQGYEYCGAGVDIAKTLKVACPLWVLRTEAA